MAQKRSRFPSALRPGHPYSLFPSGVCVEPDSRAFYKLRHNIKQDNVIKTQTELTPKAVAEFLDTNRSLGATVISLAVEVDVTGVLRLGEAASGGVAWCGVVWCGVGWGGVGWGGVGWGGVGWGGVGWGGVGWGGFSRFWFLRDPPEAPAQLEEDPPKIGLSQPPKGSLLGPPRVGQSGQRVEAPASWGLPRASFRGGRGVSRWVWWWCSFGWVGGGRGEAPLVVVVAGGAGQGAGVAMAGLWLRVELLACLCIGLVVAALLWSLWATVCRGSVKARCKLAADKRRLPEEGPGLQSQGTRLQCKVGQMVECRPPTLYRQPPAVTRQPLAVTGQFVVHHVPTAGGGSHGFSSPTTNSRWT